MDELVLQKTGSKTVSEVGELLWRRTAIAVAKELQFTTDCIISTGGGVVLNKIILDYLGGKVIYLKTSFDHLAKRVAGDPNRPLFHKEHYQFRLPLYQHYADEVIDTDSQTPAEIALKILERLRFDFQIVK